MVLFLLVLCYFNFTFGMSKGEAVQAALNRRMNQIGSADDMNFETSGLSFPSQSKEFMNFEISGISFPSHAKESFRVRSESTAEVTYHFAMVVVLFLNYEFRNYILKHFWYRD